MAQKSIADFINTLPLFNEFSPEEKQALLKSEGAFVKFKPSEFVIREGEVDDAIFIILKGVIHITKNTLPDIIISQLKAGSLFGEIALISDAPRTSNAIAFTEVVLMKITKSMIDQLALSLQKKLQDQLIRILAQRLDEMNDKFVKVISAPMDS
ncbi:hypothetical protein UR09_06410 [Candidatus Nitromaritima sp. SCGC AAA799-A02]|nr:hypothetical protein UR09_06410 [Candidatus Nitromaritima sp. SCGC AAA799-A02]